MSFVDLYEVLGITKTASEEEIKKAFRRKAKGCHPDVGGSEEDFIKIKEAYDVLSSVKIRAEYDYFYTQHINAKSDMKNKHTTGNESTKRQEKDNKDFKQQANEQPAEEQPQNEERRSGKSFFKSDSATALGVIAGIALLLIIGSHLSDTSSSNKSIPVQAISNQTSNTKVEEKVVPSPTPSHTTDVANSKGSKEKEISTISQPAVSITPKGKDVPREEGPKFTLGSTKDEVKASMGEPNTTEKYPSMGDVWRYGLSSVNFDTNGKVYGWSFIKNGKATLGDKKPEEVTFTLNSTKQEVIDAMGTPETIEKYPSIGDVWRYGLSSVNLDMKGKVSGWSFVKNGKAYMGEKKSDAPSIQEGSTKQQVIDFLGTPETIEKYPSIGDTWRYGLSSVDFDTNGKVKGWSNLKSIR